MSWFLNALQGKDKDAPRDDRGGGGRGRDRDREGRNGRGGNGGGRDQRDDGRERFDEDEEKGGGGRGGRGRQHSDSDDDEDARERDERKRQRAAREAQREREDEEDRARMERMEPAEKESRRDRFEDQDAEEDRKKQAAREQEQKAEDEARAALAADDLVQVSDPVAAEEPAEADAFNSGPVVQRKVLGHLGDPNPTWNNDAWHLYWCGLKVLILFGLFFTSIALMTTEYPIQACNLSDAFGFCLKAGPIDANQSLRCWDQSTSACATKCTEAGELASGCFQIYTTGTTPDVALSSCPLKDQFKDLCNNKKSCDPKLMTTLKGRYSIPVAMFAIWVFFEALTGAGIYLFMSIHVDEFQTELNQHRMNRLAMYLVRTYPRLNQIILIGVMIGWVLLMVGWDNGASLCADAVDNDNKPFTAFSNALAFALSYFAVVLVAIIIGTLIRKFRPIRGELYVPSNDDELTPWCGMDFKDIRDRPYPRLCPDLWAECADPDSMMLCKPCGRPCKLFWNALFSVVFAPLGWLIEQCFRHRHFMGT